MKYAYRSITAALMVALTMGFASCSKDNEKTPESEKEPEMKSVIHIVGRDFDQGALYWKDGLNTILSDVQRGSYGDELFAHKNDIYVTGINNNNGAYWKNGVAVDLTSEQQAYGIGKITVHGSDIYKLGQLKDDWSKFAYWKNNEEPKALIRPEGASRFSAFSIAVAAGKVYVIGEASYNSSEGKLVLFEDGKAIELTDGKSRGYFSRMVAIGDKVYVMGDQMADGHYSVKIWTQDGNATTLEDAANCELYDIALQGKDIYVLGLDYSNEYAQIVCWKNGKRIWTSEGDTPRVGNGVAVDGEDIYIVGKMNSKATLWKNGVPTTLSEKNAEAYDILITKEPVVK